MAKESGLGANFYVGEYDLSGDTQALGAINKTITLIEMTGIDKEAFERHGGTHDGEISWTSYWNPTNAHLALEAHPRTDMVGTYLHRGTVLGTPAASLVAKQVNYDPSRPADGSFTAGVQLLPNGYGVDWGKALTAGKRTDTAATNGTGVDYDAAGSFGLQAYLHVFAFTGTSATIKLQQSSDNGAGDAWADVTDGDFTLVTGTTFERIQTARDQAVERYLRVVTTGTFTSVQFAVAATVNRVANPL